MLAPSPVVGDRHGRVREVLDRASLDGLIVTRLPNIFYLTNLAASAAIALVTRTQLYLLTDFRYRAAVRRLFDSAEAPPGTVFQQVDGSYDEALVQVLATLGPGRYGFEAAHVPVRQHMSWVECLAKKGAAADFVPTDAAIERMRVVKDAFESGLLREAAARLSDVARGVLAELVSPGRTEHELAAEIDWRLKRAGFERTAFDTIVASGPNSALPHAHPTDRHVESGDLLLFDFGGVFHGYCVDLTRTVAVGPVHDEQRRLYRAVHAAQQAAIAAVRAGTTSDVVDAAARDYLTEHDLGDAFGHSTGHGLGLEVHEEPRLARRRATGPEPVTLERGMVCTIEPGAYVPEFGGVRLEDDVWVGDERCEVLTDVPFDDRLM
jgi:Xaa-Pro aminopeptidase